MRILQRILTFTVAIATVCTMFLFSSACNKNPTESNGGNIIVPGDDSQTSIGGNNTGEFSKTDYILYPLENAQPDTKDWSKVSGYDIIIQAGQSNAEGNGYGYTNNPYEKNDKILYYSDAYQLGGPTGDGSTFKVSVAEERTSKAGPRNEFSLAFSREYMDKGFLYPNRKLLIVRAAVGGTGFSDERWIPTGDLYLRMMKAVENSLKLIYGDNEHRLVAMLWHQGETDAINRMAEDTYYNYLKNLLDSVRTLFECPTLPFICADFVHDWKKSDQGTLTASDFIISATKRVCEVSAPAAFLPTDNLKSNKQDPTHPNVDIIPIDNIHFCREAINLLGEKYFLAFKDLVG